MILLFIGLRKVYLVINEATVSFSSAWKTMKNLSLIVSICVLNGDMQDQFKGMDDVEIGRR